MVTLAMRENRALQNLARNEQMTRRQLWCASVSNEALERLEANGAIVKLHGDVDGFALTTAGERELAARIASGNYHTIGAGA